MNTNAELKELCNETNIVGVLKSRRLSWTGHLWRAEDRIVNNVTIWKPDRTRPKGKSRQRWRDQVREDLKVLGIKDGERLALDKETWRSIVEAT